MKYQDRFGNEVAAGDWVVYGRNLGRCATTAIGKVAAVQFKTSRYSDELSNEFKIVIDSVQDDQGYARGNGAVPYIKRITIQQAERVIRYDANLVPDDINDAMTSYLRERAK